MTMKLRTLFTAAMLAFASPAFALNIVLSNDDGLTSNLAALYQALKTNSQFALSRIGTFQLYNLRFRNTPPYGLGVTFNDPATATFWQAEDEALVNATKVSVTAMQVSFDHNLLVQHWLRFHLRRLF